MQSTFTLNSRACCCCCMTVSSAECCTEIIDEYWEYEILLLDDLSLSISLVSVWTWYRLTILGWKLVDIALGHCVRWILITVHVRLFSCRFPLIFPPFTPPSRLHSRSPFPNFPYIYLSFSFLPSWLFSLFLFFSVTFSYLKHIPIEASISAWSAHPWLTVCYIHFF